MEKGQWWRQYVFAGFSNLSLIVTGFTMGWTSPVFTKLANIEETPLPDILTPDEESWIGSLLAIGAIVGPVFAGIASSTVGRKWGLLISALPTLVGAILIAVTTNVSFIYAGRVFLGFGAGMIYTLSPMYCAEIGTDEARGALGSFFQVFISIGFLIIYGCGPYISYDAISYMFIGMVVIFAAGVLSMPESPVYYLMKNNPEAAAGSLMRLRGQSRSGVQAELDKLAFSSTITKEKATLLDLFRGGNLKAVYVCFGLAIFQQLTGITVLFIYLTIIFESAESSLDPAVATIVVGVVQLLAALVGPLIVNRLNRRFLLLFSTCGITVSHVLLGVYFQLEENGNPVIESIRFLPILGLNLFVAMFCWGMGPLVWAMIGELIPVKIKPIAMPISAALYWISSFLLTKYFIPLSDAYNMSVPFWLLTAFSVLSVIFIAFLVPETKGKSFQEIQNMLGGKKHVNLLL